MTVRIEAGEYPEPPVRRAADTPTVADPAQRYLVEHVEVRCKPRTIASGRWLVQKFELPKLGKLAVDEVGGKRIAARRYRHRATPYQANRILEVVRKMFNLAEAWGLRTDGGNPCRFVQKYQQKRRERFLTDEEFQRLAWCWPRSRPRARRRRRPWPPFACKC